MLARLVNIPTCVAVESVSLWQDHRLLWLYINTGIMWMGQVKGVLHDWEGRQQWGLIEPHVWLYYSQLPYYHGMKKQLTCSKLHNPHAVDCITSSMCEWGQNCVKGFDMNSFVQIPHFVQAATIQLTDAEIVVSHVYWNPSSQFSSTGFLSLESPSLTEGENLAVWIQSFTSGWGPVVLLFILLGYISYAKVKSPVLSLLISQLPLSSSHMNVYSSDPQMTSSLVGITSSSCPADLTQKRELTGQMRGLWSILEFVACFGATFGSGWETCVHIRVPCCYVSRGMRIKHCDLGFVPRCWESCSG